MTAVTAVLLGWARALDYEIALVVLLPLAFLAYLTFVSTVIVSAMIFIERVFDLFKRR